MSSLSVKLLHEDDLPALYGILAICGEHMARVRDMHKWYPFADFEWFAETLSGRDYYGVYGGEMLIGTFTLGEQPPAYDDPSYWQVPAEPAWYFSAFAVLPPFQGRGVGRWCMAQVDAMTRAGAYRSLRFDAVASDTELLRFYDRLGYERRGLLNVGTSTVMCYEKRFSLGQ